MDESRKMLENRTERQYVTSTRFCSLGHTLKSLFWGVYGMGSPEYADLVVTQNIASSERIRKHYFSEIVGYSLWALFHIFTVIVLLNMLIAMMSDSFQRIQVSRHIRTRTTYKRSYSG